MGTRQLTAAKHAAFVQGPLAERLELHAEARGNHRPKYTFWNNCAIDATLLSAAADDDSEHADVEMHEDDNSLEEF